MKDNGGKFWGKIMTSVGPILASVALGREPKEIRDAITIKHIKSLVLPKLSKQIKNKNIIK